jgi:hypothetical protein
MKVEVDSPECLLLRGRGLSEPAGGAAHIQLQVHLGRQAVSAPPLLLSDDHREFSLARMLVAVADV